jgi:3-hydroxyacyl-[acyl-carrier-protein] dehydratase
MDNKLTNLDILEIQKYLRIRYPLIMIDRVEEVIPGKTARGYKNITINEWFFPPHFPDNPMMPGIFQIEALGQMICMIFLTLPNLKGKLTTSLSVNAKYIKPIVPGDRLNIEAELKSFRLGIAKGMAIGLVNHAIVCECEYTTAVPDIMAQYSPNRQISSNDRLL